MIRKSYKILKPHLVSLVIDTQDYFANDENVTKIFGVMKSLCKLKKMPDISEYLNKSLNQVLEIEGSYPRWEKIEKMILSQGKPGERAWEMIKKELTIGLLYPKIDSHVSAQANHLLKCPFNVHHDTGKLSLPILDIEKFDVSKCLTIFDVLENPERMEPYLAAFDKFCEPIIQNSV